MSGLLTSLKAIRDRAYLDDPNEDRRMALTKLLISSAQHLTCIQCLNAGYTPFRVTLNGYVNNNATFYAPEYS